MAISTVNKVTAGQGSLMRQQRQLKHSYQDVQRSISTSLRTNIDALNQEKAIISEGKKTLSDMTKTITNKLGESTPLGTSPSCIPYLDPVPVLFKPLFQSLLPSPLLG